MSRITLLAPGCFSGTDAQLPTSFKTDSAAGESDQSSNTIESTEQATQSIQPSLPLSPKNKSKVVKTGTACLEQALYQSLLHHTPALGELPAAALRLRTLEQSLAAQHVVCADPVHLLPDKDNARLIPPESLAIEPAETKALIKAFNALVKDDGLRLYAISTTQWVLTGQPATGLDTWPYHTVASGKIAGFLPRLHSAAPWRTLITEAQMLFHSHEVNERRRAKGLPAINGIWFWGGGALPAIKDGNSTLSSGTNTLSASINTELYANDAASCELATYLDKPSLPLSAADEFLKSCAGSAIPAQSTAHIVIVEDTLYRAWLSGDLSAARLARQQLQSQWVEPLQKRVGESSLGSFVLDGCEGYALEETFEPASVRAGSREHSGNDRGHRWWRILQRFIRRGSA